MSEISSPCISTKACFTAGSLEWKTLEIFWEYLVYPPFRANCFVHLQLLGKATKSSRSLQLWSLCCRANPRYSEATHLFWNTILPLHSYHLPQQIFRIRLACYDPSTSTNWEMPQNSPKKISIPICPPWAPWARSSSRLFRRRPNGKLKLPPLLLAAQTQTRRNPNFFPLLRHDDSWVS